MDNPRENSDPVALTKGLEALLMRAGVQYTEIQGMSATERMQTLGAIEAVDELASRQAQEQQWFERAASKGMQGQGGVFLG